MTKKTPEPERAYRFICAADGTQSSLYGDPAQVKTEALAHYATHPASAWLPVLMGEVPLPKWLTTYSLIDVPIPPTPPTPAEAARQAAQRVEDFLAAAQYALAKKEPCACGGAPTFEFGGDRLRVVCECGVTRLTVTDA